MARQDDIVRKPKTDPRVLPLLAVMPADWQGLKYAELKPIVEEALAQEGCIIKIDIGDAMKLLGTYRIQQAMYQAEKKGKEMEKRSRPRGEDFHRIIGAKT